MYLKKMQNLRLSVDRFGLFFLMELCVTAVSESVNSCQNEKKD